jgi:hypothetical protein
VEKHLSVLGYWLGLICTVLALICRILIAFNMPSPHIGVPGAIAIGYLSFFHGAALFFLLSIASWCRTSPRSTHADTRSAAFH